MRPHPVSLRERGIPVTIRLEPETHEVLQSAADRRGITVTAYCREALEAFAGVAPDDSPAALRTLMATVLRELVTTRSAALAALCFANKTWYTENINSLNLSVLLAEHIAGSLTEDALAGKPLDLEAIAIECVRTMRADGMEAKRRGITAAQLAEADRQECEKPENQRAALRPAELQFRRYKALKAAQLAQKAQARPQQSEGPRG